ncbi:AAA family ATPase [Sporomusa acidovorans]|uniref:Nuclease SbcCD subunit C n=1 Tax=Sporomusa acidovorans (strain ATCC 49682 / DSM 3132 / Mol) TaxID=1123286 RepID=A0ABZ3J174_SPOA4|nr:SMC family ATPase [Sporomusa acidovorans]OZC13645.1 chromosome partition protein Smc [Sporomusa acidovorans DSM 3132]SDE86181.1 DNA repair exonuclease SbcCD ATPase subunit [Sporomusa acidovorans]
MLFSEIKPILFQEINVIAPGIDCIYSDDELIVFKKKWSELPFIDIVGFSPLSSVEDAQKWKNTETRFLKSISSDLYHSKDNVEPSLAFLYNPNFLEELMQYLVRIERNELHCRKFVLPAVEEIHEHIMRLPIASLRDAKLQGLLPQSARKMLLQAGVGYECTNAILTQTSIEKIITNLPDKVDQSSIVSTPVSVKGVLPSNITRFKSLSIEGFRAYGKAQFFDLDADLIVIGGPNGLGKTSFFDAIDFTCTGYVSRLGRKQQPLKNLNYPDNLKVKLQAKTFGEESHEEFEVIRDYNQVVLNNQRSDRKDVIYKLTQTNLKDNVDRLIHLFRASHLACSHQAVLTGAIRDSSTLPIDLVGRMLSLEDYVQGISRVTRAVETIQREIENVQNESVKIDLDEEAVQVELKPLLQHTDLGKITPDQEYELQNIRSQAVRLRIDADSLQIQNKNMPQKLESLRLATEAKKAEIVEQLNGYEKLISYISQRQLLLGQKQSAEAELQGHQKELDRLKLCGEQYNKTLDGYHAANNQRQNNLRKIYSEIEDYKWYISNRPILNEATRKVEELGNQIRKLQTKDDSIKISLARKESETEQVELKYEKLASKKESIGERLNLLQDILLKVPDYEATKRERNKQLELIGSIKQKLIQEKKILDEKQANYNELEKKYRELEFRLESERSNLDSMRSLIHQLRSFIRDSECPLCGHVHDSQAALIAIVDQRYSKESAELIRLTSEAEEVKHELNSQDNAIRQLNSNYQEMVEDLNSAEYRATELQLSVVNFEAQFTNAEISIDDVANNTVSFQIADLEENKAALENQLLVVQQEKRAIESDIQKLAETRTAYERDLRLLQNEIEDSSQTARLISQQITEKGLRQELLVQDAEQLLLISSQKIEAERQGKISIEKDIENITNQLQNNERELSSAAKKSANLQNIKTEAESKLNSIHHSIQMYKFPIDVSLSAIQAKINEIKQLSVQLEDVRQKILTAEVIADAKQRTATVTRLRDKSRNNYQKKQDLERELKENKRRLSLLNSIHHSLKDVQQGNLDKYCKALGPIATTIQRRLRPVYGFGNMDIRTSTDSIPIRIGFDNAYLLPSDYLSDSQISIIALSIFLCVASTQTWSGLQSILLDDPVLHFDDLNLYAFADLLRTWLISSDDSTRPQIIISTCDDRLLRILRNKFDVLAEAGRAKFYLFKSISKDGPIIEEYPPCKTQTR